MELGLEECVVEVKYGVKQKVGQLYESKEVSWVLAFEI